MRGSSWALALATLATLAGCHTASQPYQGREVPCYQASQCWALQQAHPDREVIFYPAGVLK